MKYSEMGDTLKPHLEDMRAQLERKRERELRYLRHRSKKGTYTPTDEIMEQEQVLLGKLDSLLTEIIDEL